MRRRVLNIIENPRSLRQPSLPFPIFEEWTDEDHAYIKDLQDTFTVMQGLGLAAPQIGIFRRAVIVSMSHLGLSEDLDEQLVLINPTIETSGNLNRNKEACFSVPHVSGFVERPEKCEVTFFDNEGKKKSLSLEGYPAVCLQHEIDHLDGILYVDRMGSLSRQMLLRKMKKIEKRKRELAKAAKTAFDEDHLMIMGDTKKKKTGHSKKRKPKPRKPRPRRSKKR